MQCPKCGKVMEESAAYCSACGTKLVSKPQPKAAPKMMSFEEDEPPKPKIKPSAAPKMMSFEEDEAPKEKTKPASAPMNFEEDEVPKAKAKPKAAPKMMSFEEDEAPKTKPSAAPRMMSFEEDEAPKTKPSAAPRMMSFEEDEAPKAKPSAAPKMMSFEEDEPAKPQGSSESGETKSPFSFESEPKPEESGSSFPFESELKLGESGSSFPFESEPKLGESSSPFSRESEPQPEIQSSPFSQEPEPQQKVEPSGSSFSFEAEPQLEAPVSPFGSESEPQSQPQVSPYSYGMAAQPEPEVSSYNYGMTDSQPEPVQSGSQFDFEPQKAGFEDEPQRAQDSQFAFAPEPQPEPEPEPEPEPVNGLKFYSGNQQGYFGYDGSHIGPGSQNRKKSVPKDKGKKVKESAKQKGKQKEKPEKEQKDKGENKTRTILLVILLILVLGAGGWYAYQTYFGDGDFTIKLDEIFGLVNEQNTDYDACINALFPTKLANDLTEIEKASCEDQGLDYEQFRTDLERQFSQRMKQTYQMIGEDAQFSYTIEKKRKIEEDELAEMASSYSKAADFLSTAYQTAYVSNGGQEQPKTAAAYNQLVDDIRNMTFTKGYELTVTLKLGEDTSDDVPVFMVMTDGEWMIDYMHYFEQLSQLLSTQLGTLNIK